MSKAILITGASTGIGFATALHFCKKGYIVYAGVRKSEDQEYLKKESQNLKGKIIPIILDVTNREHIHSAVQEIQNSGFSLKALINNAGIVVAAPLELLPAEELKKQFDVNVFGLIEVTKAFLPSLRKEKGRIVNLSSIAGLTVTPVLSPYCASKHCVEVFSDALRVELAQDEIKVILIEPGSIKTPIWDKSKTNNLKILKGKNPELEMHYEKLINGFLKLFEGAKDGAIPVEKVVDAIEKAVENKNPSPRYLVGFDAHVALMLFKLPTQFYDWIMVRLLNS